MLHWHTDAQCYLVFEYFEANTCQDTRRHTHWTLLLYLYLHLPILTLFRFLHPDLNTKIRPWHHNMKSSTTMKIKIHFGKKISAVEWCSNNLLYLNGTDSDVWPQREASQNDMKRHFVLSYITKDWWDRNYKNVFHQLRHNLPHISP